MQVFHTPDSDQSQWNELDGMPRGSNTHSNHPNGDVAQLLLVCVVNFMMLIVCCTL
jgi:hypothetical protein